ncbi:geranyltranstransferase [Legionella beliardensis]|uniref:Geranyltranstransferase n=1 Tax=Legionella beliardensis TaxID=91822 RepID=A0A378I4X5_9GAMM|nr:farnesyl diphosphate synthase [Legionella beliardensis]STX29721.1 geranyltranstransferase [Legionella beliardensis]
MNAEAYLHACQHRVSLALKKNLPSSNKEPRQLHKAMRYAVLNGGKRIRSAFVYAVGEALEANYSILDSAAASIEMIHAYSLIHDDLPALDNDDLRRGKPTCHKVFGEATAIIAGDALQSYGFEMLAKLDLNYISARAELEMVKLLSHAIGSLGMAGGQELDMEMVNQGQVSLKKLEMMYQLKTGCLLETSILFGALAANCSNKKILANLAKFSKCIGLAFQIHDDIIGVLSDTHTLGKTQGIDLKQNKPVYPVLVGVKRAQIRERVLYRQALSYLDKTGINVMNLKALAEYIIKRNH